MQKEEILAFMNSNPAFSLATVEGGAARVRTMFLFKADKEGIVFHTGPFKEVYQQIMANPNVQLCFYSAEQNLQVRVRGALELCDNRALKEEISSHPSRRFMQAWKANCANEEEFFNMFSVFRLRQGVANVWTFASNFAPKEDIAL